jgi:hypothetical protein
VKGKDGIPTENLAKKRVTAINRDLIVFAFFLFISFGFWYLNSLGKESEAGIRYSFRYTNIPSGRDIVNQPAEKLDIYLKGPGYSILKLKFSGKKPPVQIDLSKVTYKRIPDNKLMEYYIVTTGLAKSLTVQIRSGCEITSIKPDTLFFTFEKSSVKQVQGTTEGKSLTGRR